MSPDLSRFIDAAASARNESELLSELVQAARLCGGVDAVDLLLVQNEEQLALRASTAFPEFVDRLRVGRHTGLAGKAISERKRQVVRRDMRKHPTFQSYAGLDESGFQAGVLEPLGDIGVIHFRMHEPWSPTPSKLTHLADIARAITGLLAGYRAAYGAGTAASRRMGAVSEVTDIIARSPYLEEILQLLVNMTAQQFQYRVCTVRLLDEETNELVLRATQATVKAYQRKRAIKPGESIAGRVVEEQRTIIVADVQVDSDYIGHDLAVEQGLRSMICVPLMIQGRGVGVLTCYTGEVRNFEDDEVKALETIAKQAAASIENAKLQVRHTLMQEMHHRVKNNLQQVVSLLRLQLRHRHYKSIEEAINDSLSRILAIAAVHDLLSREDLDHVAIRSIAESLVQHQQQSFIAPNKSIRFQVRGDDVRLNMTQATQVALLLNELIQNSVEHGFHECSTGEVHVNVEVDDNQVGVWVSNNGDPLPADFDLSAASHLGLQIVQNLARALGGSLVMENRLGWTVNEVQFMRQTSE